MAVSDFASEADIQTAKCQSGVVSGGCYSFYRSSFSGSAVSAMNRFVGSFLVGGSGSFPPLGTTAPTSWTVCDNNTQGALNTYYLTGGTKTNRVLEVEFSNANTGWFGSTWIMDRLAHISGIVLNTTSTQTLTGVDLTALAASGRCNADGSDVLWFTIAFASQPSGSTSLNIDVTYDDNSTETINVVIGTTQQTGNMVLINPVSPNSPARHIISIQAVTCSGARASAGNMGIVAMRKLACINMPSKSTSTYMQENNNVIKYGWEELGLAPLGDSLCLELLWFEPNGLSTTPSVSGTFCIGGA